VPKDAQVLVINGSAGVGKTTIGRALARRSPGTIHISGDAVRSFAPANTRDHLGPGSTYRAAAALAASYLDMGAARVLVDYVFDRAETIELFRRGLSAGIAFHVFTLWAPLDEVIHRETTRVGRERMGDAVTKTYEALEHNLAGLGRIIANTGSPKKRSRISCARCRSRRPQDRFDPSGWPRATPATAHPFASARGRAQRIGGRQSRTLLTAVNAFPPENSNCGR
jgi:predicted kinase